MVRFHEIFPLDPPPHITTKKAHENLVNQLVNPKNLRFVKSCIPAGPSHRFMALGLPYLISVEEIGNLPKKPLGWNQEDMDWGIGGFTLLGSIQILVSIYVSMRKLQHQYMA